MFVGRNECLCRGYIRRFLPDMQIKDLAEIVLKHIQLYDYNMNETIGESNHNNCKIVLGYRFNVNVKYRKKVAIKIVYKKNADEQRAPVLSTTNVCYATAQ